VVQEVKSNSRLRGRHIDVSLRNSRDVFGDGRGWPLLSLSREGATQLRLSLFETFEYVDNAAANQAEVPGIYRNLLFAEATHQAIEDDPLYIEEPRFLTLTLTLYTRRQLPVATPPKKLL